VNELVSVTDEFASNSSPVVVAGITRSGLTVTMQMLSAGGFPCAGSWPDFEPFDIGCVPWSRVVGSAIKLVDAHRQLPPENMACRVVLLHRSRSEQVKSIRKFLRTMGVVVNRGESALLRQSLTKDYAKINSWVKQHRVLHLHFENIISRPEYAASQLSAFVGAPLDEAAMAGVVVRRTPRCLPEMLEVTA